MITFEEAFVVLPGGWLSEPEARLLWDFANLFTGPILEVGSYRGRSTVLLAKIGRLVYAVDPLEGFDQDLSGALAVKVFTDNLSSRGITEGNVLFFEQRIEDWIPRPAGCAYLDGDHTYKGTLAQIDKAKRCSVDGIAVHDVNDSGGGLEVKRACLEVLGSWNTRVERLAIWDLRGR